MFYFLTPVFWREILFYFICCLSIQLEHVLCELLSDFLQMLNKIIKNGGLECLYILFDFLLLTFHMHAKCSYGTLSHKKRFVVKMSLTNLHFTLTNIFKPPDYWEWQSMGLYTFSQFSLNDPDIRNFTDEKK